MIDNPKADKSKENGQAETDGSAPGTDVDNGYGGPADGGNGRDTGDDGSEAVNEENAQKEEKWVYPGL